MKSKFAPIVQAMQSRSLSQAEAKHYIGPVRSILKGLGVLPPTMRLPSGDTVAVQRAALQRFLHRVEQRLLK